jgi:hypothetical protein
LTPPLVISEEQLNKVVDIIRQSLEELDEARARSCVLSLPLRRAQVEHVPLSSDHHEENTLEA